VLSVLALLVPAGGIAYLGAVSYRDEQTAVGEQNALQERAAKTTAEQIDRAIGEALAAVDRAASGDRFPSTGGGLAGAPLARYWFWLDPDGKIRVPRASSPRAAEPGGDRAADRNAPVGPVDDYLRELSRRQERAALLRAAQRTEASKDWPEARRRYAALVSFDDTGPEALLGLARVQTRLGDVAGFSIALGELDRRFGDRSFPEGGTASERVPVRLVTALMRAETAHDDASLVAVADDVLAGHYAVDPVVGVGIATRVRGELVADGTDVARLDARLGEVREAARAAAGLAPDADAIAHSATSSWRGQPASHQPGRTLIYERRADRSIIGIAVDAAMLAEAAGLDAAQSVATNARAVVLPAGTAAPDRELARVKLGVGLPHLELALVNPLGDPDPRELVKRARSRRHVVWTTGLALMLGVGLLATIRGAARARELAQLKSDFVSTVSHELKTPLTSIRMFAEMLEQGVANGDPEKMHRYHGVIVQESQRLGLLIANLLDYAQIERGTRRYTPAFVPVEQLARDAVATFEALRDPDKGRNSIDVQVSPEAMAVELEIDRDVVVQAVLNVISNAAKYGGADKPIEVTVSADAASAAIAIRDHGPGIPDHEQARIFREFYRTPDAYRSNVEGTGLGLALVKRHIEALGGSVEVASTVGEGATFTIRLPRPIAV
jgi:two-component system phosphate regulon sensor histidine kinase PhoR